MSCSHPVKPLLDQCFLLIYSSGSYKGVQVIVYVGDDGGVQAGRQGTIFWHKVLSAKFFNGIMFKEAASWEGLNISCLHLEEANSPVWNA